MRPVEKDERLGTLMAYTPYFVLPRLAIEAMPLDWQKRFCDLLEEADRAGLETPVYYVFRADPPAGIRGCKQVNEGSVFATPFYRLTGGQRGDPWADYRYGSVTKLCDSFNLREGEDGEKF